MIKSLSPYYISVPFVSPLSGLTCTDYTLKLFIWNGSKSSPPILASYEFTKTNPTGSILSDEIDISNVINDFISFAPQEGTGTELIDGNNQLWIKWLTFYTTADSNDSILPSNQNTKLMTKGYNYGMDGKNAETPTNKILLSGTEFKVNRNGIFVLPIEIEETPLSLATLVIDDIVFVSEGVYELYFTATGNIDPVYYLFKESSDLVWGIGLETSSTSPFEINSLTVTGITYNVQLFAYDNDNAVEVSSNIFNVIT